MRPEPSPPLLKRWSRLVRALWAALALSSLALLIASVPARYQQLAVITPGPNVPAGQLQVVDLGALSQLGWTTAAYALWIVALESLAAFAFWFIGVFVFLRRSNEVEPFLFSLALAMFGLNSSPLTTPLEQAGPIWAGLLTVLRPISLITLVVSLLVFPDSRFVPSWTHWLALGWLGYMVLTALFPSLLFKSSMVFESGHQVILFVWTVVWFVIVAAVQVYRYRCRSSSTQRQQTRWVIYGIAVVTGSILAAVVALALLSLSDQPRTTLLLARLIAIAVVLLQRVFVALTGQQSDIAVVASTLIIAALALPLRNRIQAAIDRRFYRRKYDVEQTLEAFAARLQNEVDTDTIATDLKNVIQETLQPASVKVWLVDRSVDSSDERRILGSRFTTGRGSP